MSPRPIPKQTRAKLTKLLPRLASSFDGERTATLAAIERVLTAEGLDWHDFTAAFFEQAPAAESGQHDNAVTHELVASRRLLGLIANIEARDCGRIDDRSRAFLASIRRQAQRRHRLRLSSKQLKWLTDLAERTGTAA